MINVFSLDAEYGWLMLDMLQWRVVIFALKYEYTRDASVRSRDMVCKDGFEQYRQDERGNSLWLDDGCLKFVAHPDNPW